MSVRELVRHRPIVVLGLVVVAGCTSHTYGLTVTPAGAGVSAGMDYLARKGFTEAPGVPGDEVSMERQRGDSVDHIRLFHGGGSPECCGSSPGTAGSGGAYTHMPNPGVTQTVPTLGWGGLYSGATRGPSPLLTLEMTTYKMDTLGRRHAVEPTDQALDDLDSVIALVAVRPRSPH